MRLAQALLPHEGRPSRNPMGPDRVPPVPPVGGQVLVLRKTLQAPVARNAAGAGAYTAADVSVYADTPDARLLASLSFGFRQDGKDYPDVAAPYAGHAVTADLFVQTEENLWLASNHIYDFTQSPTSYTFRAPWTYRWSDTPGRVVARLTVPGGGTGLGVDGNWWATAQWGLAPGAFIPDDELRRLLAACQIIQLTPSINVTELG